MEIVPNDIIEEVLDSLMFGPLAEDSHQVSFDRLAANRFRLDFGLPRQSFILTVESEPLSRPATARSQVPPKTRVRMTDDEYLRHVEALANDVADRALDEGWLTYGPGDDEQSSLQRAINELARNLRHVHEEGDGCVE